MAQTCWDHYALEMQYNNNHTWHSACTYALGHDAREAFKEADISFGNQSNRTAKRIIHSIQRIADEGIQRLEEIVMLERQAIPKGPTLDELLLEANTAVLKLQRSICRIDGDEEEDLDTNSDFMNYTCNVFIYNSRLFRDCDLVKKKS